MIARLLERYAATLPIRVIYHEDSLYLKRYYVATIFGYWRVYLHHFVGSDPDGLHNHPWRYGISFILCGSYKEERRFGTRHIRFCNIVNGDTLHRVIILHDVDKHPCWSLFIHSPRCMNWAFLRNKGIFTQYLNVGHDDPGGHSQWHLKAPTGAQWELAQRIQGRINSGKV